MKNTKVPHPLHQLLRLPGLGRVLYSRDPGDARGAMAFQTHLAATHIRRGPPQANSIWERVFGSRWQQQPDGRWARVFDLGSGLVTNIGVLALANDMNWASPSAAAVNLFKLLKYHATGTGATAAATTDYKLQAVSTQGGQTPVSGTQVFTPADNLQKIVSVATIAYTGGEAVTEWGWFNRSTLTDTTGTPFTATSATSGTVTATPLTASSTTVQGSQQSVLNTTTTPRIGLITSNTTSIFTIPGWLVDTTGATGSTPGATEAFSTRPVMFDHKVFSAINVVNGDSIQFTYSLTIVSGG
jgi:hypothetical protein